MAEYKAIHGFTVQNRTTDPLASGVPGATWATGGNINTGREGARGAGVSQTAVVIFGGNDGADRGYTENYNGSAWTEVADMNTGKTNSVGTGTYTAAIAAYTGTCEIWDGSSWSEVSELNTPRSEQGSLGTSTAALSIGNQNAASAIVEQWNGSSWSEVGDLTTAVGSSMGIGTTTAGLSVGGYNGSAAVANNMSWNGSSWTEIGDINTARYFAGASGTSTEGLIFAGYKTASPASEIAVTEFWNGSTWTELADLSTARFTGAPSHNSTSLDAIYAGGNPGDKANTEEWTGATITDTIINTGQVFYRSDTGDMKVTLNVLGTGAWASGGNTNHQDSERGGSAGTQTAGLIFGGGTGPAPIQATTEQYNGSTWTEVSALNTGRQALKGSVNSPYTSAIGFGGASSTTNPSGSTLNESWNGSSWTEIAELNTAAKFHGGCGTTTDALKISGQTAPGSALATVEKWNG